MVAELLVKNYAGWAGAEAGPASARQALKKELPCHLPGFCGFFFCCMGPGFRRFRAGALFAPWLSMDNG
jgi:hypothetical protein